MNEQQVFEAVFKATGVGDFQKAISGAQESVKSFEGASKKIRDAGSTLTKRVTAPLVALGGIAMAVGSQYETSMSSVQAISGATADEMEALEAVAREMGATTRYSASESADALGYMALAGWDVEQMTSALPDVLNLATAGQLDLATASDIVTDMMSMFGIEAENASQASDVFAAAQAKSNTNVEQLSEALRMAGPAASSAGNSLEDTSAVLGILANNGIKGSSAGTALNAMFMDLQKSAENGAVAIGDTSVAVYDAEGNMRSMVDIVQGVEKATKGMSDEQRNAALSQVFQQRSLRGVNVLLNEGTDSLVDLQNELINSSGAAQDMADVMDDNMQGSLLAMKSAAEEVAIQFFEMAEGPVRAIIDGITELIRWFGELSPVMQQVIGIVGVLVASIGPLLMLIGQIGLGVSALGKFFVGTSGSVSMFAKVIAALTSPVTLVIGAIAALIGVLIYLYNTNEEFRNKVQEIWRNIQLIFEEVTMIISEVLHMVFDTLSEWWAENQQGFFDIVNQVWTAISEFFIVIFTAIGDIINAIWQPISDWYQENNELIRETIDVVWNEIADTFMEVMTIIGDLVTAGFNVVSSVIEAVMPYVETIIDNVMYAIMNVISLVMGIINGDWDAVWNSIKNIARSVWNAIKALVEGAIEGVKATINSVLDAIFGDWDAKWNQIKDTVSEIWEGIKSAVSEKIEDVKTSVSDGIQGALDTVTGFYDRFKEAGRSIIGNITDGISSRVNAVKDAVGGVLSKARNLLPFSPPKDKSSPMVGLEKNGIVDNIAQGIMNNEGEIQRAMNRALNVDMPMMNGHVSHSIKGRNVGRSINVTQYITSPNALNEREMQRRSRLELQKLGVDFAY